jgi:hypothetical protein
MDEAGDFRSGNQLIRPLKSVFLPHHVSSDRQHRRSVAMCPAIQYGLLGKGGQV